MRGFRAVSEGLAAAGIKPSGEPHARTGGSISDAWRLDTDRGPVFIKTGPASQFEMFTAERDALLELAGAGAVRVPRPLLADTAGDMAWLVLEWLDIQPADTQANRAFGRALAELHRHRAERFGWHRDNWIGATPQPNARDDDWLRFYRDKRLAHQLSLAADNGYTGSLQAEGEWLCDNLARLFANHSPEPSLLHGDLWGGNWAAAGKEPVMFDPATWYGDRETDLAMTRLFGGFRREFYAAYEEAWPLDPGADARLPLYQLYHVLNHLNLFGGGYLARAEGLIAELRRTIEAGAWP